MLCKKPAGQAGLRPVPTLWLDQPPLGMSKPDSWKDEARPRARSLFLLQLSGAPELLRAKTRARLTWKPARRTLSQRNQPSEGV